VETPATEWAVEQLERRLNERIDYLEREIEKLKDEVRELYSS